jgi:hypothetical protein
MYRFRLISRFPIPWASYQCNSARRVRPLAKRMSAIPFSFRQRPRPYCFRRRATSRMALPTAIGSMSVMSLMISKCMGVHCTSCYSKFRANTERQPSAAAGSRSGAQHSGGWRQSAARRCSARPRAMCAGLQCAPHTYWITSSARRSSDGGIVIPSALAVLRLMTSSNFVGCSTGRSAGFAPFRILST